VHGSINANPLYRDRIYTEYIVAQGSFYVNRHTLQGSAGPPRVDGECGPTRRALSEDFLRRQTFIGRREEMAVVVWLRGQRLTSLFDA